MIKAAAATLTGGVLVLAGLVHTVVDGAASDAAGSGSVAAMAGLASGGLGVCDATADPGVAVAAAQAAGFTGPDLAVAVAVAGAESGYDSAATHTNRNGSTDYGLWQINSVHAGLLAAGTWSDPFDNAVMAHAVWKSSGWSAWTTWRTGAYRPFLGSAAAASGDRTPVFCGGVFTDPALPGLPRANRRTVAQAVMWARQQAVVGGPAWFDRCLNFVAQAYGWSTSGTPYAIDHFWSTPPGLRATDRDPPPGALVYWTTARRPGHVALYLGQGLIASTDIRRTGWVDVVPFREVEESWGATYVGWSAPYFPAGG